MDKINLAYEHLATAVICMVAVLIVACLIRSVLGPRVTDRIVAVNSIGTMTITVIALFSVLLEEAYRLDVALIYAMISFVAVIVLFTVSILQETGLKLRESLAKQNIAFRWMIYLIALIVVLVFGIYGPMYDAADFIYQAY